MPNESHFLQADPAVEAAVRTLGGELFRLMDAHPSPGILSKKGAYARIMEWSMKDPAFKAQLFRFVDVLPSLSSSAEIVRHLQEYLGDKAVELSPAMRTGLAAAAFAPALVAGPVKANVTSTPGPTFVAGATPEVTLVTRPRQRRGRHRDHDRPPGRDRRQRRRGGHAFLRRNTNVLETVGKAVTRDGKAMLPVTSARGGPAPPQPLREGFGPDTRGAPGRSRLLDRRPEGAAAPRSCAAPAESGAYRQLSTWRATG